MLYNKRKVLGYVLQAPVVAAAVASPLAAITVGISAISAYNQYEAGQDAADAASQQAQAQKASIAAQGRIAEVDAQRQRIAQVREARIRKAQVLSSAGNTGLGSGTSAISGATSSVRTQASANIGTINQTQTFANEASVANQQASDAGASMAQAGARAQQWQTIGTIFGASKQDFTTIFGGETHKKAGT